jgi:hypothetical protein
VGQRGTVRAGDYIFLNGKETKIINWEEDILYTKDIISS